MIEQLRAQGSTIILTTHYMEEAEQLCDDIAIIDHGQIIARGSPDALLAEHFPAHVIRLPKNALAESDDLPLDIHFLNNEWEIYTESIPTTLQILEKYGVSLEQFQVAAPTLEDLFLKLTGEALRS